MRGTQFQKPWELTVNLDGEQWSQGGALKGQLTSVLHGDGERSNLTIQLARGEFKKIKKSDQSAFELLEEVKVDGTQEFEFEFPLSLTGPVSEKSHGVFLIYGEGEDPFAKGMLELPINPHKHILSVVELFEMFFRFKHAGTKFKKGAVEMKFKPPGSRDMAAVKGLNILFSKEGSALNLDFEFSVEKLDYTGSADAQGVKAVKKKIKLAMSMDEKNYLLYGDGLNQSYVQDEIQKIIEQIKTKTLY